MFESIFFLIFFFIILKSDYKLLRHFLYGTFVWADVCCMNGVDKLCFAAAQRLKGFAAMKIMKTIMNIGNNFNDMKALIPCF